MIADHARALAARVLLHLHEHRNAPRAPRARRPRRRKPAARRRDRARRSRCRCRPAPRSCSASSLSVSGRLERRTAATSFLQRPRLAARRSASIGGCDANSAITPPPPVMPNACSACGSSPGCEAAEPAQRVDHRLRLPSSRALPASARNSRQRENHATIMRREDAEHDLADDHRDEVAGPGAALGAEHRRGRRSSRRCAKGRRRTC